MFRSCYAKSLIYVTRVDCVHCGSEEYEFLLAVSGRGGSKLEVLFINLCEFFCRARAVLSDALLCLNLGTLEPKKPPDLTPRPRGRPF